MQTFQVVQLLRLVHAWLDVASPCLVDAGYGTFVFVSVNRESWSKAEVSLAQRLKLILFAFDVVQLLLESVDL